MAIPDFINLPSVTKDAFDGSKNFFGMTLQQGALVFDYDITEFSKELNWYVVRSIDAMLSGTEGCARMYDTVGKSFEPSEAAAPTNDITFSGGYAVQNGRLVFQASDFEYNEEEVNYVVLGQVTEIIEVNPALYRVRDSEKLFNTSYDLKSCRMKVLTGSGAGTYYINSLDGYDVLVDGDLSKVSAGDTYRILPPEIETPTADDTTDTFYMVTWWEDISPMENRVLEDPTTFDAYNNVTGAALDDPIWGTEHPSHRRQLRWCIYANYDEALTVTTDPTGISEVVSHMWTAIASCNRDSADADINTADITDTNLYFYTLDRVYNQIYDYPNEFETASLSADALLMQSGSTSTFFDGSTVIVDGSLVFGANNVITGLPDFTGGIKVDDIIESTTSHGVVIGSVLKVDEIEPDGDASVAISVLNAENVTPAGGTTTINGDLESTGDIRCDLLDSYTNPGTGTVLVANDFRVAGDFLTDSISAFAEDEVTFNNSIIVVPSVSTDPGVQSNNTPDYYASIKYDSGAGTLEYVGNTVGFDEGTAIGWDGTFISLTLLRAPNDNTTALTFSVNITAYDVVPIIPVWSTDAAPFTVVKIICYNSAFSAIRTSFSISVKDMG